MFTRVSPFLDVQPESLWINGPCFICETKMSIFPAEKINNHMINLLEYGKQTEMVAKFISCIEWSHYTSFCKLLKHIV